MLEKDQECEGRWGPVLFLRPGADSRGAGGWGGNYHFSGSQARQQLKTGFRVKVSVNGRSVGTQKLAIDEALSQGANEGQVARRGRIREG